MPKLTTTRRKAQMAAYSRFMGAALKPGVLTMAGNKPIDVHNLGGVQPMLLEALNDRHSGYLRYLEAAPRQEDDPYAAYQWTNGESVEETRARMRRNAGGV